MDDEKLKEDLEKYTRQGLQRQQTLTIVQQKEIFLNNHEVSELLTTFGYNYTEVNRTFLLSN